MVHASGTDDPWFQHSRPADDARMERTRQPGDVVNFEAPEWAPLRAVVDDALVEWFMWMHEVRLVDGTPLHAYKHRATRRYLHLDPDGRAWWYDDDTYVPFPRAQAVRDVFVTWPRLGATPADMALVDRARARAAAHDRRERAGADAPV